MKLILHIGMPKCGSSALQVYLSSPRFKDDCGGRHVYAALGEEGTILHDDQLWAAAEKSPLQYIHTQRTIVANYREDEKQRAISHLHQLAQKHDTIILSCEGWGISPELIGNDHLFAQTGLTTDVIAYVRPQIEYCNSAWWQWGAWEKQSFNDWLEQRKKLGLWYTLLQQWSNKAWVNTLDVRLMPKEIVKDFMAHLGFEIAPQARVNQNMPDIALRLLQRHPFLKNKLGAGATFQVLARTMNLPKGTQAWVLSPQAVSEAIEYFRVDNERLATMLSEHDRHIFLHDARWWSPDAYRDRTAAPVQPPPLDLDSLEQLTVAALQAILTLDTENRHLRARLARRLPPKPNAAKIAMGTAPRFWLRRLFRQ